MKKDEFKNEILKLLAKHEYSIPVNLTMVQFISEYKKNGKRYSTVGEKYPFHKKISQIT